MENIPYPKGLRRKMLKLS